MITATSCAGRAQDDGLALTTAAAWRCRAVTTSTSPELEGKGECEPRTGHSDRMAQRDRTAVDVAARIG